MIRRSYKELYTYRASSVMLDRDDAIMCPISILSVTGFSVRTSAVFVPGFSVKIGENGGALDYVSSSYALSYRTDTTNRMCQARDSGSELFGFIGLRVIHPPSGPYSVSFPKATHVCSSSMSAQCVTGTGSFDPTG